MRVITHVLRGIDDENPLRTQLANSPATAELVNNYNTIAVVARAAEDENLALVSGETYGQDLKRYVSLLPLRDAHRLLDQYLSHFPNYDKGDLVKERGVTVPEQSVADHSSITAPTDHPSTPSLDDDTKEDKQFHRWLAKCVIVMAMCMVFIIVGVMIAIVTHNHMADNAVFTTIMSTATEIIKILFTSK